jgi:predicted nuclease of predicted toxin-antitoxin system
LKIRGLKFKIDENLPAEFAAILREAGFDAATVAEEALSGATDTLLLKRCRTETRVLLTLDLDFANVQAHPPGTNAGIMVFRSKAQDKLTLISLLRRTVPVLKRQSPEGQLWIVQADRVRIRE